MLLIGENGVSKRNARPRYRMHYCFGWEPNAWERKTLAWVPASAWAT